MAGGGAINLDSINALFLSRLRHGRRVLFLRSLRESTPMISAVLLQHPVDAGQQGL